MPDKTPIWDLMQFNVSESEGECLVSGRLAYETSYVAGHHMAISTPRIEVVKDEMKRQLAFEIYGNIENKLVNIMNAVSMLNPSPTDHEQVSTIKSMLREVLEMCRPRG